ncbi:dihydrofolate reductase [Nocardia panacis]|uniref:Dihydrofolate reductase n=2 Tax=Nocardia panacis TaxID=2340916 RepID=A0A3A4L4A4_9NOCA|nr:dihydrofolate reductase [Nocardia panacis]
MTLSLDGFVCGLRAQQPPYLDDGFFRITSWAVKRAAWRERAGMEGGLVDADDALIADKFARAGAYVMGRRMFDSGEEPWGDEPPFHAPVFVVTNRPRSPLHREGGTTFYFVDSVAVAVEAARKACAERNDHSTSLGVHISGGASIVSQAIAADMVDELHLHIAPVLLGQGTRLFDNLPDKMIELRRLHVIDSPEVTHLAFRLH